MKNNIYKSSSIEPDLEKGRHNKADDDDAVTVDK
jgi:hypothetical protein